MEEERIKPYKPFAITATRKGDAFKLYTMKGSLAIARGKDNVTLGFTIPPTKEVNFAFKRDGMEVTRKLIPLNTDEENIRIYKGEDAERFLNEISEQFFTAD